MREKLSIQPILAFTGCLGADLDENLARHATASYND